MFVEIREPHTKKLLFKYDAERGIIEIQQRGIKTLVDLKQYEAPQSARGLDHGTYTRERNG
jgi:hypothetical protein